MLRMVPGLTASGFLSRSARHCPPALVAFRDCPVRRDTVRRPLWRLGTGFRGFRRPGGVLLAVPLPFFIPDRNPERENTLRIR